MRVKQHTNADVGINVHPAKPDLTVLTLYTTPPVDVLYSHVLFRIQLEDDTFLDVELSSADSQRLGHALNRAGGGTLA